MSYTPPEDGAGWRTATSGTPSPQDGVPSAVPSGGSQRTLLFAAVGGVAALVIAAAVVVIGSSGGDGGAGGGGDVVGGALSTATTVPTSVPSNAGTVASSTTIQGDEPDEESAPAGVGLPTVTIPAESSPPTTIPGSEPSSIPTDILSGEEAPEFGTVVVDLAEGGYEDFAVQLRTDQEVSLLSLGDDGIGTEIEVFAPDGTSEGWWAGGEPGVVNGLEWYLPDEPLPATGTYVIRVIHTGGSHEPFALGFFGTA